MDKTSSFHNLPLFCSNISQALATTYVVYAIRIKRVNPQKEFDLLSKNVDTNGDRVATEEQKIFGCIHSWILNPVVPK